MDDFGVNNLFNEDDEPEMQAMPVTENKKKAALVSAFDWLDSIVVSVIAVVLIFTFLFRVVGIVGDSMNNTLIDGDRVVICNLFYTRLIIGSLPACISSRLLDALREITTMSPTLGV